MVRKDAHSSYSIHNDIVSLRNLEEQLAKEHPDWTPEQVRAERHFRWRNGMGKAQLDSFKAENRGDETMRSEEAFWDVKNGDLVHPNYGPFQGVIDNAVSQEERASLIAWRDAAIHAEAGAQIISLDYHNGTDIRFADAWVKDGSGRIKQEVRARITNGKDLSGQQGLSFLSQLTNADRQLVINRQYNVGIVVIKPSEGTLKNIAKELSVSSKTFADAGKATAKEITYTTRSIQQFLEKRKQLSAQDISPKRNDSLGQRLLQLAGFSPDRKTNKRTAKLGVEVKSKVKKEKHKNKNKQRRTLQRNALSNRPSNKDEKGKVMKVDAYVVRRERKIKKMKAKYESRRQIHRRKELRMIHKKEKKLKLQKKRTALFIEKIGFKKRKIRKEVSRRKQTEKTSKETIIMLLTLANKLFRRKERARVARYRKSEVFHKARMEKSRQLREHVLDFSIAYIFWFLLRGTPQSENEKKNIVFKQSTSKELARPEPTKWILLAIIWHLAMLREQGQMQASIAGLPTGNAGNQTVPFQSGPIPPSGVIFASAS